MKKRDRFLINSKYFYILSVGMLLLLQNEAVAQVDPSTWVSVPTSSVGQVSMEATTGFVTNGPVEYYFEELSGNPGGDDSGWQLNPVYVDTGLSQYATYSYTYRVRMRDALANVGDWSSSESASVDTANVAALPVDRDTPYPQWLIDNYTDTDTRASAAQTDQIKVVFVGDSISYKWLQEGISEWNAAYNETNSSFYALNRGVAGDRTEHVLYRILSQGEGGRGDFDDPALTPELIVLMIGINNTWASQSNDQIIGGIHEVVVKLTEKEPQADIMLLSILPTSTDAQTTIQVNPINAAISLFPSEPGLAGKVTYFDLHSYFLGGDGKQDPQYFSDGVHLVSSGYNLWRKTLEPILHGYFGNTGPDFVQEPTIGPLAVENVAYSNSIEGAVIDAEGDTLAFSKLSGPAWLNISTNGTLTGTPTNYDLGTNSCSVQVVDGYGGASTGTVEITVLTDAGGVGSIALVNPDFETDPPMGSGTPTGWTWNGLGNRGTSAGGTLGSLLYWQGDSCVIYQTTDHIITTSNSLYTLTVDCRNSWFGSPKAVIYYDDGTNRVELGSAFLPDNGSTWSSWDTITAQAVSTAASVGKNIGVELTMENYPGNHWAEFDNVLLVNGDSGGGVEPPPPPPPNPAAIPSQPDISQGWISNRYFQIIGELDSNTNRAKAKILFVGDSITQFWNVEGSAVWTTNGFDNPDGPMYALNLGEAGDRTEHVLHRIQAASEGGAGNLDYADLEPKTIVLMIGINNTWFHSNEEVIGGIQAVVESLSKKEPQATIILSSILPHWEASRNQDIIIPINTAIEAYVDSGAAPNYVVFLDAYPTFVDGGGAQIASYFKDGIHMTEQGYVLYSSLLLPLLDSSLVNYESWAEGHGLAGGPTDDDDSDGLLNIYEYGLGGNPTNSADTGMTPYFYLTDVGGTNWIEYVYPKRSALGNRAYYHLQTNPDLISGIWVNGEAEVTGIGPINGDFDAITNRIPVDLDEKFIRLLIETNAPPEYTFMFPEGRSKSLIMSYDDGPVSDQTLIGIFDNYGIKGTFNLNSGVFGQEITWLTTGNTPHYYVSTQNVATAYSGHEVASHTVSHPHLTGLSEAMVWAEITNDMAAIEALINTNVISFAYPFGSWNETVIGIVEAAGLNNARTTGDTLQFSLPSDTLRWNPTTHDSLAPDYLDEFLALSDEQMSIFFVWGHSWEYDIDASERPWNTSTNFSWASIEDFCSQVGSQSNIWYAGAGEVASYLNVLDEVVEQGNGLFNQADVPVWVKSGDNIIRLEPGEHTEL